METDQNYVSYYDPIKGVFINDSYNTNALRILVLTWMFLIAIGVLVTCNLNLLSEEAAMKVENFLKQSVKLRTEVISILKQFKGKFSQVVNEAEEKSKSTEEDQENTGVMLASITNDSQSLLQQNCLKQFTKKYAVICLLVLIGLSLYDLVKFIISKKVDIKDWLAFFPMPILGVVFGSISLVITTASGVILVYKHKEEMIYKTRKFWYAILPIPWITTLVFFITVHCFWIILLFGIYPDRLISSAIFFVPLFFMLKPTLKTLLVYANLIKDELVALWKENGTFFVMLKQVVSMITFKELYCFLKNNCLNLMFTVFALLFWGLLLGILYMTSDFFLIVTDIRNDPITLITFAVVIVATTFRLTALCKPPKPKKEEKEEGTDHSQNENEGGIYEDV